MDNRAPCPVCRTPNVSRATAGQNTLEIHCPRCGRFHIQTLAETQLMNSPPAFPPAHLLSGLCRNTWDLLGERLLVTVDLFKSWNELDRAAKLPVPRDTDLVMKGDYLLKYLRRRTKTLADAVPFSPSELAVGFCANKNELLFCLRYLTEKNLIEEDGGTGTRKPQPSAGGGALAYRLTPAGWAALERPVSSPGTPPTALVALNSDMAGDSTLWTQGFAAGVQAAGYTAVRLDSKEHANKIDDDLVVSIRRAALAVIDLTGQDPLAFFQAGAALGLGKPVFWTCEENELRDKKIALETRQYSVTPWARGKADAFAQRLAQRIEAALGRP